MRRLPLALTILVATWMLASGAAAGKPRPAHSVHIAGAKAQRAIPDLDARGSRARLRRHFQIPGLRTQTFYDPDGRQFAVSTAHPTLVLQPYADLLASTYHGKEIRAVETLVTSMENVVLICRSQQAVACYIPDDPERFTSGDLVVSYEDPDLVHTILHEYGHHVDNQHDNLPREFGCNFSNDGSRRWFFKRPEAIEGTLDRTGCDPQSAWEFLLGELYAEDYAQFNGIDVLQFDLFGSALPPDSIQLRALKADIDYPYEAGHSRTLGRFRKGVRRARNHTWRNYIPKFVELHVRSRAVRAIALYQGGKLLARGRRGTRLSLVLEGRYTIRVYPSRRGGRYRVVEYVS